MINLHEINKMTFLLWKWHVPGSARAFNSKHVNVVLAMISRWYARPFRLVCITDDARGLDPRIEAVPMPDEAKRFLQLRNPTGARFPSCYCRLWIFSRQAAALGERIFQLDIDMIVTGDLTPLVDRDEDFVGWSDPHFEPGKIAGGAFLLRTGAMPELWDDFDPATSPAQASAAGYRGSDQGWISYKLCNRQQATGTRPNSDFRTNAYCLMPIASVGHWRGEGLIKLNWTERHSYTTPPGARIVFTNGEKPPWNKELRNEYPWIRKHWKNAQG